MCIVHYDFSIACSMFKIKKIHLLVVKTFKNTLFKLFLFYKHLLTSVFEIFKNYLSFGFEYDFIICEIISSDFSSTYLLLVFLYFNIILNT